MRVKLNKGRRGIALDKLERFVADMRKFLAQVGDDLQIPDPRKWVGVDFENSSLAFTNESENAVSQDKSANFNSSILALGRSEYPPFIQEATANQFFNITSVFVGGETADLAVFDESDNPIWFEISNKTGVLARKHQILPFRHTQGAVQGTIHNIFVEAERPYFTLRELSSQKLVKCFFKEDDYAAVVESLKNKGQILHVRGVVTTETSKRDIDHITVSRIVPSEPYSFADVKSFLGNHWRQ
ncbi:hypothetical protein HDF16_004966 [Granulicella aggregans]|uniref:Uncharacterized protein n=1 Tax=Granulicella aggregans TaxID=474949 RepID=A0A7W8E7G3_9BACT|nr:hypothetical protein [Granulicella aggregans]MBB5060230.1 hypothetical protein [Granulicella aggregans]